MLFFFFFLMFSVFVVERDVKTCKGYSIQEFLLVPLNNFVQKWVCMS